MIFDVKLIALNMNQIHTERKKTRREKRAQEKLVLTKHVSVHKLDWLEWIAIGCAVAFCFIQGKILFTILLIIPILGLLLNGISRPSLASLISFSKNDGKEEYDVADFIEIPGLVIFLYVIFNFEFESFYSIMKVGTIGFALLLIIVAFTHSAIEKGNKNLYTAYFFIIGNIAIYSYAGTYGINCMFDNTKPIIYNTYVLNKRIIKGRYSKSYKLKVKPWGNHREAEEISVSKTRYEKISIGNLVSVDYKEGLLGIPWYYID